MSQCGPSVGKAGEGREAEKGKKMDDYWLAGSGRESGETRREERAIRFWYQNTCNTYK